MLQFFLMSPSKGPISDDATEILTTFLSVTDAPHVPLVRRLHLYYLKAKAFTVRQVSRVLSVPRKWGISDPECTGPFLDDLKLRQ
jgi:hypothetical protein